MICLTCGGSESQYCQFCIKSNSDVKSTMWQIYTISSTSFTFNEICGQFWKMLNYVCGFRIIVCLWWGRYLDVPLYKDPLTYFASYLTLWGRYRKEWASPESILWTFWLLKNLILCDRGARRSHNRSYVTKILRCVKLEENWMLISYFMRCQKQLFDIFHLHARFYVGKNIGICRVWRNWMLILHFLSFKVIRNFVLLCGRYQKYWSVPSILHTWW